MNKLVLLSVFLVGLISSIFSQNYIPFPTNNASWIDSENCQENHYQISGDTVVNNITYHQLEMTYKRYQLDQLGDCDYNSYWTQATPYVYFGCFRNDSAAKSVYFLPKDSTHEKLLYDFNYVLGDTLRPTYSRSYNFNYPNPLVVTKIDSILISSTYHRTISFISCPSSSFGPSDTLQLIEGIGSNSGLFSSYDICNYYVRASRLYCHRQNGQVVFSDAYGNCNLISSIENPSLTSSTVCTFSPNPTRGKINITTSQAIEFVQVFNVQGQVVKKFNSPITSIDIGELNQGVYFLSVLLVDGRVHSQKIIKQ